MTGDLPSKMGGFGDPCTDDTYADGQVFQGSICKQFALPGGMVQTLKDQTCVDRNVQ